MVIKFDPISIYDSCGWIAFLAYLEAFIDKPREDLMKGEVRLGSQSQLVGFTALLDRFKIPFLMSEMTPSGNALVGPHEGFGDGGKGIVVMRLALVHDHTGDGIKFRTYEEQNGAGAVDVKTGDLK